MPDGRVLHADHDGIQVLRVVGEIRYTMAPTLERFLAALVDVDSTRGFVVDLTQCTLIDSTNLGLLARLARRVAPQRVTLVSDQEDINIVLDSMGFRTVFDIVDATGECLEGGTELAPTSVDREQLRATMLNAHRTLMELNENNKEMFRDVVIALELDEPTLH
jgi:anti-anti-sigma factor